MLKYDILGACRSSSYAAASALNALRCSLALASELGVDSILSRNLLAASDAVAGLASQLEQSTRLDIEALHEMVCYRPAPVEVTQ